MITDRDPYLLPYKDVIDARQAYALRLEESLIGDTGVSSLKDFATAHDWYGLHFEIDHCILREYAPAASGVYLIGSFCGWQASPNFRFSREGETGDWILTLPRSILPHGTLYKLLIHWEEGWGERIPTYAQYVVQDPQTHVFSAAVWQPDKPYRQVHEAPSIKDEPLLIYEAHIGMSQEMDGVASYEDFRTQVLPRIVALGYNAVQLMAIQEHPYYGSFGYHVSSLFAPSSRFGTPDDLRRLIDTAHAMGLVVIMDIVHSHMVKNEVEAPCKYDGTRSIYFHEGARGLHPAWDSICFDYGSRATLHLLLSNCRYWMDRFGFDGYRFDGVTSMIYLNHGLEQDFLSYKDYFDGNQDGDAIAYLILANKLIHEWRPRAISIAEEVSGMPGLAAKISEGGLGFDYRLAMNIPDYWIKIVKEQKDEDWKLSDIYHQLTNRRADEQTISYVESHDQALVGDKTLLFRLIDAPMYWHMSRDERHMEVDRGLALIKMIRLATVSTINGGYLNFMANEFGHPDWIDFPREGNGWSYQYARRQWSLSDNPTLRYAELLTFDRDLLALILSARAFHQQPIELYHIHDEQQTLAYGREDLLFIFNFHPSRSYQGFVLSVPAGKYITVLNTDAGNYGGFGFADDSVEHFTRPSAEHPEDMKGEVSIYLPARSAIVFKRQ